MKKSLILPASIAIGMAAGTLFGAYELWNNYWSFGAEAFGTQLVGNRARIVGVGDGFIFGAYTQNDNGSARIRQLMITREKGITFQDYSWGAPRGGSPEKKE